MRLSNSKRGNKSLNIKKGFTLIELLTVLVLLGIVLSVGISTILRTINSSKEKAYEEQINRLLSLSETWAEENGKKLPLENETYYLTVEELKTSELLEQNTINPKNNELLGGCIKIVYNYDFDMYNYSYNENDYCPENSSIYTISYDLDGGELGDGITNPETYTPATPTTTLNNPKKEGYIFKGWETSYSDKLQTVGKIYRGSSGNLTFKAVYDTQIFVRIDPNGGVYNDSSELFSFYSDPYDVITLVEPTRKDYYFIGWESDATDVTIKNNEIAFGATSITLTAKWTNCLYVGNRSNYTYTGNSAYIDDGNGAYRLKFLTSGKLTMNCPTNVDTFLVGGGSSGGGSGYTQTYNNISLIEGKIYTITVGDGGTVGNDGTASKAFGYEAAPGNGGNGGSGVGGSGYTGPGYKGGSNGSNGSGANSIVGGKGQGTTTCEFGEQLSDGTCKYKDNGYNGLYAGGGGGGTGWCHGHCPDSGCNSANGCYNGGFSGGSGGTGGGGRGQGGSYGCANGIANTGGGAGLGVRGGKKCSGGSGIVIIRNINCIGNDKYCYTGESEYIDDGNGNYRIKLLTDGNLTLYDSELIDIFLVGGGSSGGGSGYTLTQKGISVELNKEYTFDIGNGGYPGNDGSDTIAFKNTTFAYIAKAGNGGDGGSGVGQSSSSSDGYGGGSNGYNGSGTSIIGNWVPGSGQGITTCEFGEQLDDNSCKYKDNGYEGLYAGGGGGGGLNGTIGDQFVGGSGGLGGGGCGSGYSAVCSNNGADNTGGGAGLGAGGIAKYFGGSGIAIIRNSN